MTSPEQVKVKPINRLKSMYALRAEVDKMYAAGEEAADTGKPVAWVMLGQWAEPILTAMDIISIYPENYGSVCAAGGKAGPYLDLSDAEGFPSHVCGYARNCFGYSTRMKELGGAIPPEAPMGGMPRPDIFVASSEICDARFKWFQALGRYFNAPIWTIESPYPGLKESIEPGTDERSIRFIVTQLREFVDFLEQRFGHKINYDKLEESARGLASINRVRWEINRLRRARPGPMHSKDLWSTITAAFFRGSESGPILDGFIKMKQEVQKRVDKGISALNVPEKFRLSFDGLPPWHSLDIFDKLAARGWNFVIESNYRPYTPNNIDLSKYADPLERYVRERFQSQNNIIDVEYSPEEAKSIREEINATGNSTILQIKHIRDCQCDGMMIHILLSCRSASLPLPSMQQKAQDLLKVPALVMEGDMVNASLFDPADVMKKAEAFEETMTYYKQLRKEAGIPW